MALPSISFRVRLADVRSEVCISLAIKRRWKDIDNMQSAESDNKVCAKWGGSAMK